MFFLLFRCHFPAAAVWISAKPKGMQRTFLHGTQFYFLCIAAAAVQALLTDDFYGVCLHDNIPPFFVVRPHPRGTGKRGCGLFVFQSENRIISPGEPPASGNTARRFASPAWEIEAVFAAHKAGNGQFPASALEYLQSYVRS